MKDLRKMLKEYVSWVSALEGIDLRFEIEHMNLTQEEKAEMRTVIAEVEAMEATASKGL